MCKKGRGCIIGKRKKIIRKIKQKTWRNLSNQKVQPELEEIKVILHELLSFNIIICNMPL